MTNEELNAWAILIAVIKNKDGDNMQGISVDHFASDIEDIKNLIQHLD